MVVGYYDLRALFLYVLHFFRTGNSAVHCYEKLGEMFFEQRIDSRPVEPVAVLAFGDVDDCVNAEIGEGASHNRRGANTVGIVITVNGNCPAFVTRRRDKFHRFGHSAHTERRNEVRLRRVNKRFYLFFAVYTPAVKNFYGIFQKSALICKKSDVIELFCRKFKFGNEFLHKLLL